MKIKFNFLNNYLDLSKNVNILCVNNYQILNKIYYNFRNDLEDSLIVIENNKEINFKKNGVFLSDPFCIDINTKKNLLMLYEKEAKNLPSATTDEFEKIKTSLITLIEDMIFSSTYDLDYDEIINIIDIFALFKVKFSIYNEKNFCNYFCNFIKIISGLNNLKIIITYNFLNLFTKDELAFLNVELEKYNISLLDITFNDNLYSKKYDTRFISIYRIDEDLCEY
jgi:CRISPR type II-A-associated protein Csn2